MGFRNLQEKLENIPYILEGTIKEFWDTEATSFLGIEFKKCTNNYVGVKLICL